MVKQLTEAPNSLSTTSTARQGKGVAPSDDPSITALLHSTKELKVLIEEIRSRLQARSEAWKQQGFPGVACEGKLLRPFVACQIAASMEPSLLQDDQFWDVLLALQMVHEASLLHDDIIDEADKRRGQPTHFARHGTAVALVAGDHLLTTAYRLVANAENPSLFLKFTEAVEQTVAGEIEQATLQGKTLSSFSYTSMIAKKSGALFAFAAAVAPLMCESKKSRALWLCGLRLGCQYQRLDDIFDYCSHADSGKPPFQDYHQQKPTWPWVDAEQISWHLSDNEVHEMLFSSIDCNNEKKTSLARMLLAQFIDFNTVLRDEFKWHLGDTPSALNSMMKLWERRMEEAIQVEEDLATGGNALSVKASVDRLPQKGDRDYATYEKLFAILEKEGVNEPERWENYFAYHSRSFSFAAQWFPYEQRQQIARIYAYCRVTDELADGHADLTDTERLALLDAWESLTRRAYRGQLSHVALLDQVIPEMAENDVPLDVAFDLIEGMRIDIRGEAFDTGEQLLRYCHCVASTVGLWCTHLFTTPDQWLLARADALGKAMQLTNILRDVGEDLERGRIYLPKELLSAHTLSAEQLWQMKRGELPILPEYIALLEGLLEQVDQMYELAFEAMPYLPKFFARPVAVAAEVYRGIHEELRNNGYNNLTRRARTSFLRKLFLAPFGLWRLRQARKRGQVPQLAAAPSAKSTGEQSEARLALTNSLLLTSGQSGDRAKLSI